MSALTFSKRVKGSVSCPVVQTLWAAGNMTSKRTDGDLHQDLFCWCCRWHPLGLLENGKEILQLFTLEVGILLLSPHHCYLFLSLCFSRAIAQQNIPLRSTDFPQHFLSCGGKGWPWTSPCHDQCSWPSVNLNPVPAGHTELLAAGLYLAQSSSSCRLMTLWPWYTAAQPRKNKLSLKPCLAALRSVAPHSDSHFPLPLPAQGNRNQELVWKGPWPDRLL